jgi:hypothetical protein
MINFFKKVIERILRKRNLVKKIEKKTQKRSSEEILNEMREKFRKRYPNGPLDRGKLLISEATLIDLVVQEKLMKDRLTKDEILTIMQYAPWLREEAWELFLTQEPTNYEIYWVAERFPLLRFKALMELWSRRNALKIKDRRKEEINGYLKEIFKKYSN